MRDVMMQLCLEECVKHPEVDVECVELGKHRGLRLTVRGVSRTVTLSRSASDVRAAKNARTDVRRTIAFLKGEI
jgi:hypothetical protein